MRLPGTQRWDPEQVERVIGFELGVARNLPTIVASMAEASDYFAPEDFSQLAPSDGIFALVRAAEVSFATDQFERGIAICRELITASHARPRTPMQLAQWATVGVVTGLVKVRLDSLGVQVTQVEPERAELQVFELGWPPAAAQAVALVRRFIPAAIGSGPFHETVEPMLRYGADQRRWAAASAMIELTEEAAAAEAFSEISPAELSFQRGFYPSDSEIENNLDRTFGVLEQGYVSRLVAMARTPLWDQLRVRGNLVDWGLLALWIARLRRRKSIRDVETLSPYIAFTRVLAGRLKPKEPLSF